MNWSTTPDLNKNGNIMYNLVPKDADWKKLLILVRLDGASVPAGGATAEASWPCWMPQAWGDGSRAPDAGRPLGSLWCCGGRPPSRQTVRPTASHLRGCCTSHVSLQKQTVGESIRAEAQRNAHSAGPDLKEGQDGFWVNCSFFYREPTCIYADLNLNWFSEQDATVRSANRHFASVAGDGAEPWGRFLNDNDPLGWGLRVGAGANSRRDESARMTIPVRHVAGRPNGWEHVASSSGVPLLIFVLPLSPVIFCMVCHNLC